MIRDYEDWVKVVEEEVINNNTAENRSKLHAINAAYIRYLKLEDSILRQKTQLQWFNQGDTNSKYFHALTRGRTRKFFIHKICKENGEWIQGDENISREACDYFERMFTGHVQRINEEILECVP